METIYEKASETAKKVRKTLKEAFPNQKFSVRSKTYSMGCSVDVSWIDGVSKDAVQKITDRFEGKTFDGMTDSSSYHDYQYEGKMYSGADYVFANRTRSPERIERLEKACRERFAGFETYNNEYCRQMNEMEKILEEILEREGN